MLQTLKLLLPALLPSWRFFDEIVPSPRIEVAYLSTDTVAQEDTSIAWFEFRPRPQQVSLQTMLLRLFWNPDWNENLFLVSCSERLMSDPSEHSETEIARRIQEVLKNTSIETGQNCFFMFRLVFVARIDTTIEKQVTFQSNVFPISGAEAP